MGLKKKKNIIFLTLCMIISFIMYQLYFFLTISSETSSNSRVIPVIDYNAVEKFVHVRSNDDKFINENGVIRGILYQNMRKYRPNAQNNFKCLETEQSIPFEQVNDDYCDCEDGTDEPSTSACVDGKFYCDTQHHKSSALNSVPSNQVNDGICDCCDGSDEWLHEPNKKLLSQSNSKHYAYYVSTCSNACTLHGLKV